MSDERDYPVPNPQHYASRDRQRVKVRGGYEYGPGLRDFYRDVISLARVWDDTELLALLEWMIDTDDYEQLYDEGIDRKPKG